MSADWTTSSKERARRVSVAVKINGADISEDMGKYLLSLSYSDEQEGKTDDLSITIDDREGIWLQSWLNPAVSSKNSGGGSGSGSSSESGGLSVGDPVKVKIGAKDYNGGGLQAWVYSYDGFTVLEIGAINPDRIVVGINGVITAAVHVADLEKNGAGKATGVGSTTVSSANGLQGASLAVSIIQKDWEDDGERRVLDCGEFTIDTIKASGPPTKITIKATSLPAGSSVRAVKKNKSWENIRLSAIAAQIAAAGNLKSYFSGDYDPVYSRKEQSNESDISFLSRLCVDAGMSLKVTAGALVIFDEDEYEKKPAIRTFSPKKGNVLSYSFSDGSSDKSYSSCHVSWTDTNGTTIEYTYTPRIDNPGTGEVLEISERVDSREEARKLAMKRLKAKNKDRFSASLKIIGDAGLAAGATVNVSGWGTFDGKYMIKTAAHSIGSGYTTDLTLRKCLGGYDG